MDLLQSLIELLGLPADSTPEDVLQAVTDMQAAQQEATEEAAEQLAATAVLEGRISVAQKAFYKDAAKLNYKKTVDAIAAISPRTSLAAQVKNPAPGTTGKGAWTLDDYRKNAPQELAANPALLDRLMKEEYGA